MTSRPLVRISPSTPTQALTASALALGVAVALFIFASPTHAKERFEQVKRPIDDFGNTLETTLDARAKADLELAPLTRLQAGRKRDLGKGLVEIGRLDLTGYQSANGRLVSVGLEEPLGGAFDNGVLEGRGLENGGRFETRGFETPIRGFLEGNGEPTQRYRGGRPIN